MQCLERDACKYICLSYAMRPSKRNRTSITFKGKYKILEVYKAVPLLLYMLCDIIYKILNILSLIYSLTVAQV